MTTTALGTVLHRLCRSLLRQDEAHLTDGELLACFISQRDETAFEALLRRHGPMVLGVCRRVLRNEADAEDAFQATFLVLVRKAATIRPRSMVGNWLYGVAHSTALKTRAMNTKRLTKEREAALRPKPEAAAETGSQLHVLLDQELKVLPDKYRAAIVLCDLEGKTRKEAARQLGVPDGTLAARLARGRGMLAKRLARHGLAVSGGSLAVGLSQKVASACVPTSVVSSTIKAAPLFAAGRAAATGVISVHVAAITEGVLKAMLMTKLKIALAVVLLTAIVFGAASVLTYPAPAAGQTEPRGPTPPHDERSRGQPAAAEQKSEPAKDAVAKELKMLEGEWEVVALTESGKEIPADELKGKRCTFKGGELYYGGEKADCTVKIDPTKNPKHIDLLVLRGDLKGKTQQGIYKLEKDRLIICVRGYDEGGRPTEFIGEKEGAMITLEKVKK